MSKDLDGALCLFCRGCSSFFWCIEDDGDVSNRSRYEEIAELFNHMTCSLRLLNLCKKPPTFWNVSAQVEVLAKR